MRKATISVARLGLFLFSILPVSCNSDTHVTQQAVPVIRVEKISVSQLPAFDLSRTYYLLSSNLPDPVALLSSMWMEGIPVSQAWLPLDDRCGNPVGARFTVELTAPDSRMQQFGFTPGEGQLSCATQLNHYTIMP